MATTTRGRDGDTARRSMLSPAVRGIAWMVLGGFVFVAMVLLVRVLSADYNAIDLAFWRAVIGVLLFLPMAGRIRRAAFASRRHGLHFVRAVFHFVAIAAWFYAIGHINLSMGTALQFTIPLFTIVLAALCLGERVDAHRWAATAVGFLGVLIVVRPDRAAVEAMALVTLFSAVCYGASNTMVKALSRTETSDVIVFCMNFWHVPMAALALAIVGWTTPAWDDMPLIAALALSASLAHYCLAQAFRATEASRVMPLDFLKLPWVAGAAYVLFGETPAPWAWVGGAMIFAATYYIIRREAALSRRARDTG